MPSLPPWLLLSLAPLFWAGNWIVGRALHETAPPLGLNFWRWAVALVFFAILLAPRLRRSWPMLRRYWWRLAVLAACGTVIFHGLVYTGLRYTEAINGVLLNSFMPVFFVLLSRPLLGERLGARQGAGMLVSFIGVLVIVARGDPAWFGALDFNPGDGLILLALPFWALYSVLLRRWKMELDEVTLMFGVSLWAVVALAPLWAAEILAGATMPLTWSTVLAALYVGIFASGLGFLCWNRGVAMAGANRAGVFVHMLPAWGIVLSVIFLGETPRLFHFAGIGLVLAGVALASSGPAAGPVGRREGSAG